MSDDVTLSCLRYTRAPDGRGLIALLYDERFKLGQVDGGDVKASRKRTIDAMAKFDMREVKVGTHAESKRNEFPMLRPSRSRASRHGRGSSVPAMGAGGGGGGFGGLGGGGFGGLGGSIGQPISGYGRPGGGVRPDHPTHAGRHIALHRLLLRPPRPRPRRRSTAEQRDELAVP